MSAAAIDRQYRPRGPGLCLLVGICLWALSVGCGDSGSDGTGEPERIEAAVRELQKAVAADDGERACNALSHAARQHVRGMGHDTPTAPSAPCYFDIYMFTEGIRKGSGWREQTRRKIEDIEIDGDRATATVDFGDGQSAGLPFVEEKGEWKVDALYGGIPAAQHEDHY